MKLRNKKSGEIGNLEYHGLEDERIWIWIDNMSKPEYRYNSLAELNSEWEDYKEPEEDFWYIDSDCETYGVSRAFNQNDSDDVLFNKSIGNYFETKEEAEKAVEKLKAWKRLKDKGFEFEYWTYKMDEPKIENHTHFKIVGVCEDGVRFNDLDLLFGDEE